MTDTQDVHAWDLVIGPDNRRLAEAAIAGATPNWESAVEPIDWRRYVPVETRERWPALTEAERSSVVADAVLSVMYVAYEWF